MRWMRKLLVVVGGSLALFLFPASTPAQITPTRRTFGAQGAPPGSHVTVGSWTAPGTTTDALNDLLPGQPSSWGYGWWTQSLIVPSSAVSFWSLDLWLGMSGVFTRFLCLGLGTPDEDCAEDDGSADRLLTAFPITPGTELTFLYYLRSCSGWECHAVSDTPDECKTGDPLAPYEFYCHVMPDDAFDEHPTVELVPASAYPQGQLNGYPGQELRFAATFTSTTTPEPATLLLLGPGLLLLGRLRRRSNR